MILKLIEQFLFHLILINISWYSRFIRHLLKMPKNYDIVLSNPTFLLHMKKQDSASVNFEHVKKKAALPYNATRRLKRRKIKWITDRFIHNCNNFI